MKKLFLLTALGLSSVYCMTMLTSCTKHETKTVINNDTTFIIQRDTIVVVDAKNPITGTWAGTYGVTGGSITDTSAYVFYISTANRIVTQSSPGGEFATGTWALSGTNFTALTTGVYGTSGLKQSITATYDSTAGTLIGTYQNAGTSTSGYFNLKRVE